MEKETTTGSSALLTGIIPRQVGKGGKCPCILILVTPLIVSRLSFSSVQFPFPVTLGTSNLACPEFLQDRFFQGCPFQGKALSSLLWSKCHLLGPQLSPALCIPHPALLLPFFSYCRSPQEVFLQLLQLPFTEAGGMCHQLPFCGFLPLSRWLTITLLLSQIHQTLGFAPLGSLAGPRKPFFPLCFWPGSLALCTVSLGCHLSDTDEYLLNPTELSFSSSSTYCSSEWRACSCLPHSLPFLFYTALVSF